MEWVETTGRTVDDAKESALDELGVDEVDAEFQVLEEPRTGLFGRVRGEARVRARVKPKKPRPKEDRRKRRGRGPRGRAGEPAADTTEQSQPAAAQAEDEEEETVASDDDDDRDEATLAEQTEIAEEFLHGLVEAFGVEATVSHEELNEDTVEVRLEGQELGLLIGPRAATLGAVQELTRTVLQRRVPVPGGRVLVDVAGYRRLRREALERFTRDVAQQAQETGARKALEPMSAADRKVVHDTVNTIDGVHTVSEGEEPRRRVVIVPDNSSG